MKNFLCTLFLAIAACLPGIAGAVSGNREITQTELCLQNKPRLTTPPGWAPDKDAEEGVSARVFVKKGTTFETSPAVIYAKLVENQKITIDEYAAKDISGLKVVMPDFTAERNLNYERYLMNISDVRVFKEVSKQNKQFELVVYGTSKKDEILLFVYSASTQKNYKKYLPKFMRTIRNYTERE